MIAFTYESTLLYSEETGWIMAHEFYHMLDGKDAFVHKA